MRRPFGALALLLITVLLTGCFFDHPLTDRPSKDINTWLLGAWEHKTAKGELYKATVLPLTGGRYTVWLHVPGKKAGSKRRTYLFEAWISEVGRNAFLTMQCKDSADDQIPVGSYTFLHYQVLDQNHVRYRLIGLDSPADTKSYDLRAEVRQRLKDGTLFPNPGTDWTRTSEVYWNTTSDAEQPYQPLRFPINGLSEDAVEKLLGRDLDR